MIGFSRGLHGFSGLGSQSLRVGFDARSLCGNRTGVGTYAANLIEAMLKVDPGFSPVLFSAEALPLLPWLGEERVRTVARPAGGGNNVFWTNVSLRRAIAGSQIDLFHSPGYTRPLGLGLPSIVTLHDVCYAAAPQWYPYHSGLLRQSWYRRSALGANAILTDSEFSRREIMRVYEAPPDRVYTIYPGVDHGRFFRAGAGNLLSGFLNRYEIQSGFLLFVGDIHPRRNIGRVTEALHQVKASNASLTNLELAVIGRVMDPSANPSPFIFPGLTLVAFDTFS